MYAKKANLNNDETPEERILNVFPTPHKTSGKIAWYSMKNEEGVMCKHDLHCAKHHQRGNV
jgi:hypothetical protein